MWLACYDPFEDNAEAADGLWDYSGAVLSEDLVQPLTQYLGHAHADVRSAAAAALAAALEVRERTCFGQPVCFFWYVVFSCAYDMMCKWQLFLQIDTQQTKTNTYITWQEGTVRASLPPPLC